MIRTIRSTISMVAAAWLAACVSYPASGVEQGGVTSGLTFPELPKGAVVSVDGGVISNAADFDGKDLFLAAAPGPHRVTITKGDEILLDRNVYLGRDSKIAIEIE